MGLVARIRFAGIVLEKLQAIFPTGCAPLEFSAFFPGENFVKGIVAETDFFGIPDIAPADDGIDLRP